MSRIKENLTEDENIDRLNAKLDYYINNKLGSSKVKELSDCYDISV